MNCKKKLKRKKQNVKKRKILPMFVRKRDIKLKIFYKKFMKNNNNYLIVKFW